MKYQFDGGFLYITFRDGKEYKATMGGLFDQNYSAFFGFLIGEVEFFLLDRLNSRRLAALSLEDVCVLKNELVRRVREQNFIERVDTP